jgi:hypothetical protein
MKNYLFLLLIISMIPVALSAQSDYYGKNNTIAFGAELIDGGYLNSEYCQVKKGKEIIRYTASDIDEFGFKDGRNFKAFTVVINNTPSRFFLERITDGKIDLYQLSTKERTIKYYLVKKDSSALEEIPQSKDAQLVMLLRFIDDNEQAIKNIPDIRIRKDNLKRYINDYNRNANRPQSKFHYGFNLGLTGGRLAGVDKDVNYLESIYSIPQYKYEWNISIGVLMDLPIKASNFSFHPELNFTKNKISETFRNGNSGYNLLTEYTSLSLPLLIRYSILKNKITPFFEAGPIITGYLKNDGSLHKFSIVDSSLPRVLVNSPVMHNSMGGYSVGAGIISGYGSKFPWFVQMRYNMLNNISRENRFLYASELSLLVGLFF